MDKIRVNTQSLARTQSNVDSLAGKILGELSKMESSVAQMNSMWSGTANSAFNKAFQDDMAFLENVCKDMKAVAAFEGRAKTEYDTCEQKVGQLVASIKV